MPTQHGFTLIELVLVIVLLGILAVVAVPRLNTADFDEYAYAEETLAALRYARQTAVARNDKIAVDFSANAWQICTGETCTGSNALTNPGNGRPWNGSAVGQGRAPAGVAVSGPDFHFDGLGRPSFSSVQSITLGSRSLTVHPQTGHVEAP